MEQDLLNLYYVDMKYVRSLQSVDDKVMSISPQIGKATRPFLGVVIIMNKKEYCIPLTSPNKDKFQHKAKIDFIKIPDPKKKDEHGTPKIIGVLNLNNMIPVSNQVIKQIDLSDYKAINRELLINELGWCRDNSDLILNRANKIYNKVTLTPEKDRSLTRRCCDFKKLEQVLEKWLARSQTNKKNFFQGLGDLQERTRKINENRKNGTDQTQNHKPKKPRH